MSLNLTPSIKHIQFGEKTCGNCVANGVEFKNDNHTIWLCLNCVDNVFNRFSHYVFLTEEEFTELKSYLESDEILIVKEIIKLRFPDINSWNEYLNFYFEGSHVL